MSKPQLVAIVGLEHFNRSVWDQVKADLAPVADLQQFTEWELERRDPAVAEAIRKADALFITMINFKEQADWLREQVAQSRAQVVLAFESMPEVMALNRLGDYVVAQRSGQKGGMPEPIKQVVRLLVRGRDEDTLYGYTQLLKLMPTLLRFLPAKLRDFKNWMQVNLYWNQPLPVNITNLFRFLLREYFGVPVEVQPVVEVPLMGLYHPDAPHFFKDLKSYRQWQAKRTHSHGRETYTVALLFFRKHLLQERSYIDALIRAMEAADLQVLPIFVAGVEGHVVVRDWLTQESVDVLVSTIGFALVGGPAGSTSPGTHRDAAIAILERLDVPYLVAQPLYVQDVTSWHSQGVGPMQAAALYDLPEMDGAINPVVIGALDHGHFTVVPDRVQRLVTRVKNWARLRHTPNREKRIAFVVYDYPPGLGKKATAALLDVPRSLLNILRRLKAEGYTVGALPETPEALLAQLEAATTLQPGGLRVTWDKFCQWTTPKERERVEQRWGPWPGDIAPAGRDAVFIGGLQFGNIYIGVQPRLGVTGDPMRLLFDKENTPHHQYLAFYRWLSRGFGAHALVHVGMHGSVEWMPGLPLGLTQQCWPDVLLGELPQLYLYPMNNPSEANIAKRRGYAVMVSHGVPPLARAGLYKELAALQAMVQDYRERQMEHGGQGDPSLAEAIAQKVALANLDTDCPRLQGEPFDDYVARLYAYLRDLEQRLITSSLHVFGEAPPLASQQVTVTEALKVRGNGHGLANLMLREVAPETPVPTYRELAARARQGDPTALRLRERVDEACREWVERAVFHGEDPLKSLERLAVQGTTLTESDRAVLQEAAQMGRRMAQLLQDNRSELEALVRGLNGRYIPPAPGGDLIRDGLAVLPTGRNIHAIDPWRIPSELAYRRGKQIADALLAKHLAEHNGQYPETVAQVIWGLDTIKTKGEAVAVALHLIGARPHHDSQGKISHYQLIPLKELGRPRIDVLMQLSPIFRDTFAQLMDHLDRLVKEAARADEPLEMNFIKKHVEAALQDGLTFEQATARLFTQPPGQYGTYVDDLVEDAAWQTDDDLAQTFIRRNAYAYGGGRHGQPVPQTLERLLRTVERVAHTIDSVEFGVTDIDHYFASSGALQLAARKHHGGDVPLNYIETFTADTRVEDLPQVLRLEYRTKLLNPHWYEGMLQHGHSGAAEISNRFTYLLGWDAVSGAVDDWTYTAAARTYALDPTMRERLTKLNPQAMRNIVGRLLEANGRGLWQADADTIAQLREIYADLEDRLEGVAA
ncbi:MAG: magnesium chelatase subunit H [Gloeomargarita sp. SKYBB_i_bin120]|nr:magnesium chelatase subunit H [Gloeomargarita sp. SKYG98]MCS7292275.1 magnesium chelatase subunit H [Gloeomargarita sp. SKYB120]MDW8177836.1 magnesium chelatase subunit H [Gloeomargarita sp. SKYBB_i_bin120]